MKTVVIIGAGSIGRGFIGQIFSEAGWLPVFLDVAAPVVDGLNREGGYPLEIVSNEGSERKWIAPVSAVNGGDREAAARVTADADLAVTCVGAKALRYIVPNLAAGVKLRRAEGRGLLDLLICENLMDADRVLRSLLEPALTPEEMDTLGLVETSVGRMVPLPDPELLAKEPLLVRAEAYGILPCDRDAFRGPVPDDVPALSPESPFRFAVERKLWIHNMGHAVCAYLGLLGGYERIADAVADPDIRTAVREAMAASARMLAKRWAPRADPENLTEHTRDLLRRFGNRALGDTCLRVGRDVPRKLAGDDRLTGAALAILAAGERPVWQSLGAAAALAVYLRESGEEDAAAVFGALTGVTEGEYREDALAFYAMIRGGADIPSLVRTAGQCPGPQDGFAVHQY